jgi:hypothetical protein
MHWTFKSESFWTCIGVWICFCYMSCSSMMEICLIAFIFYVQFQSCYIYSCSLVLRTVVPVQSTVGDSSFNLSPVQVRFYLLFDSCSILCDGAI